MHESCDTAAQPDSICASESPLMRILFTADASSVLFFLWYRWLLKNCKVIALKVRGMNLSHAWMDITQKVYYLCVWAFFGLHLSNVFGNKNTFFFSKMPQ